MRIPGWIDGSYRSRSPLVSKQRTINLYPERVEAQTEKNTAVLYPVHGLTSFATFTESPGRGIFYVEHAERLFTVQGQTLYELDSLGAKTSRGTVARDSSPVSMISNGAAGDELMVVSGDEVYMLDLATNTLSNPDSDAVMGGMLDSFFIKLDPATSLIAISDSNDGTTWDPTQFVQRSSAADPWKSLIVVEPEFFLFGAETSEVYYNAGTSPFPFQRRPGAHMNIGIVAPFAATPFDNTVAWVGRPREGRAVVYRANGYTPQRISDHGIENIIQGFTTISDCVAWAYERLGHSFLVLDFPSEDDLSMVFDAATNRWHERGRWDSENMLYRRYRPQFTAEAFGKQLVCDCVDGAVYELDDSVYSDVNGGPLRRMRIGPHLASENDALICHSLELELQRGVGTGSGQGDDPQVMMRYSVDGGQTWSNEEWVSAGQIGEYLIRARWLQLGAGRDWLFEIVQTDPTFCAWIDLYGEFERTEL